MGVVSAPDMGGVTEVRQIQIRLRRQKIEIPFGISHQGSFLLGRQRKQMQGSFRALPPSFGCAQDKCLLVSPRKYSPRLSPCLPVCLRCLGDNDMRVRPTKAKGADTTDPCAAVSRTISREGPFGQCRGYRQRRGSPIDIGIRRLQV